jgi:phosphatidylserine decarboxylase
MPYRRISFIDRTSGQRCLEKVFGDRLLRLLYAPNPVSGWLSSPLRYAISRWAFFSKLVGWYYSQRFTRRCIKPFIETYEVDSSEFIKKVEDFISFSDFFIRELRPECRPITAARISL